MAKYWVSYRYANFDDSNPTSTMISVNADSEREAKKIVEDKHRMKSQKVIEWRKITL